jgi:hypothetical protein
VGAKPRKTDIFWIWSKFESQNSEPPNHRYLTQIWEIEIIWICRCQKTFKKRLSSVIFFHDTCRCWAATQPCAPLCCEAIQQHMQSEINESGPRRSSFHVGKHGEFLSAPGGWSSIPG